MRGGYAARWHGLLENDAFRDISRTPSPLRPESRLRRGPDTSVAAIRTAQVDLIADLLTHHVDLDLLHPHRHGRAGTVPTITHALTRWADYCPTGRCSTSRIGKSFGLPVHRAAPCTDAVAAMRQSAWWSAYSARRVFRSPSARWSLAAAASTERTTRPASNESTACCSRERIPGRSLRR